MRPEPNVMAAGEMDAAAKLRIFAEIGRALTGTLDTHRVLAVVMEKVHELFQPRNWSLLLLDEEKQELYFEIVVGEGAEKLKNMRLALGEGIAGWVARTGEPLLIADVRQDERFCAKMDAASKFITRSIVCVPLRIHDRILGVIEIINHLDQRPFSEDDMFGLAIFADFAAIALENASYFRRIQHLTVSDDHTPLYNARFLHEQLARELDRAEREGCPLSLLFFDLDRFKQVNDQHGHLCGSKVLREIGELLLRQIEPRHFAVRFGGDEFVLLLPETDKPAALALTARLRQALNQQHFLTAEGLDIRLTASFGLACFPADGRTKDDLMRLADTAMYKVKESGRDGILAAIPG